MVIAIAAGVFLLVVIAALFCYVILSLRAIEKDLLNVIFKTEELAIRVFEEPFPPKKSSEGEQDKA
jgi:hypothetical protein